jgi:hypothetical protein
VAFGGVDLDYGSAIDPSFQGLLIPTDPCLFNALVVIILFYATKGRGKCLQPRDLLVIAFSIWITIVTQKISVIYPYDLQVSFVNPTDAG